MKLYSVVLPIYVEYGDPRLNIDPIRNRTFKSLRGDEEIVYGLFDFPLCSMDDYYIISGRSSDRFAYMSYFEFNSAMEDLFAHPSFHSFHPIRFLDHMEHRMFHVSLNFTDPRLAKWVALITPASYCVLPFDV